MRNHLHLLYIVLTAMCCLLCTPAAQAQPQDTAAAAPCAACAARADTATARRTVTRAQMAGVGGTDILDTYLSPEKYHGTALTLLSQTERRREGRRWSRMLEYRADVSLSRNRADNASDLEGMFGLGYGMHRHWTLCGGRLLLKAGGMADVNIGFLYNTRNGNNPAQARFAIDLAPTAAAAWLFSIRRTRCRVGYEVAVPVAGLMFSPNYGQSYYEIFSRGNYDHNIVPTTIACAPQLRHMLSLDIALRRCTLRMGYLGLVRQAEVNNLKSHTYTHSFMIGVVRTFYVGRCRGR